MGSCCSQSSFGRRYDKKIKQLGEEKYPQTRRMRSIHGVGPITSLAFVLNLDNDVTQLKTSRGAGPRMGLRPKQRDSGNSAPELSITKSGDAMRRRRLVQCGQSILGPFGTDSRLRRWGLKLAARGGKAAKRKAVVAVSSGPTPLSGLQRYRGYGTLGFGFGFTPGFHEEIRFVNWQGASGNFSFGTPSTGLPSALSSASVRRGAV